MEDHERWNPEEASDDAVAAVEHALEEIFSPADGDVARRVLPEREQAVDELEAERWNPEEACDETVAAVEHALEELFDDAA